MPIETEPIEYFPYRDPRENRTMDYIEYSENDENNTTAYSIAKVGNMKTNEIKVKNNWFMF